MCCNVEDVGSRAHWTRTEEALEGWDQILHQSCRNVGSRASRTQSPKRLKDNTTSMIASPGQTAIHHAWSNTSRPSATRLPQVGAGGGTPAPRKLRADSTTIPQPICSVASTTTLLTRLGEMWTTRIRLVEDPATCARATKSRSFTRRRVLRRCPRQRQRRWP